MVEFNAIEIGVWSTTYVAMLNRGYDARAAWDAADRVVERRRDEEHRRAFEASAPKKTRPADGDDQADDDLNH